MDLGSGKTTLSKNIGNNLNIKVTHLDGLNFSSNWVIVDSQKRDDTILKIIQEDSWIIDGYYSSTLKARIEASDLVIFLNYSTISKLISILSRYFKLKNVEKKEIPGCTEKMDFEFFKFVITWNSKKRKKTLNILGNYPNKNILIFKNRRQLNNWYLKNFNRPIDL